MGDADLPRDSEAPRLRTSSADAGGEGEEDGAGDIPIDKTLEDIELPGDLRDLTMAELKARDEVESDGDEAPTRPPSVRVRALSTRDDELLGDPPRGEHHLGRFAGWRAAWAPRWIVGSVLAVTSLVAAVIFVSRTRQLEHERRHPLPELEATISPDTPREMSLSEGKFRVALGREAPAVHVLHLPDRDIRLARGSAKAQFKVEVRNGETVRLQVLTGRIRETLTRDGAKRLLD